MNEDNVIGVRLEQKLIFNNQMKYSNRTERRRGGRRSVK
jgi:hypothetical protein